MRYSVESLTSGVDWLTLTLTDEATRKRADLWAKAYLQKQKSQGEHVLAMTSYGYEGWRVGGISYGVREDCDIVQLAGGRAEEHWYRLQEWSAKCTRCDVQVTTELMNPEKHLARTAYRRLVETTEKLPQRNSMFVENTSGGETLYIGSRSSEQYGRFYDKSAQLKEEIHGRLWRYEVEFKGDHANEVYHSLTGFKNRAMIIAGTVRKWYSDRGVLPVFESIATAIQVGPIQHVRLADTRLAWLRAQVAPTVRFLTELGLRRELYEALGLEDKAWPSQ